MKSLNHFIMKKIITIVLFAIICTSCNSRKCKLDGCNNKGIGWLTTIEGGCTVPHVGL